MVEFQQQKLEHNVSVPSCHSSLPEQLSLFVSLGLNAQRFILDAPRIATSVRPELPMLGLVNHYKFATNHHGQFALLRRPPIPWCMTAGDDVCASTTRQARYTVDGIYWELL
jgi:hypothetical protein